MRLKLTLQTQPNSVLAYEHHHALRAVIYRILQNADKEFSEWLHEKGYALSGNKRFKLFSFGLLTGLPYRRDDAHKCLIFPTGRVEWEVSFCVDRQVEKFVEGLFKNQHLEVATGGTKVVFQVQNVQILEKPTFTDTMRFKAHTGICLTEKTAHDRYPQFRSPDDDSFKDLFFSNLSNKVETTFGQKITPPQYLDLKIMTEPKKWSAIVPQDNGQAPIKTIGYRFDFEVTAPAEWLRVGYFAGFGGKNSGGFGFCEVLS